MLSGFRGLRRNGIYGRSFIMKFLVIDQGAAVAVIVWLLDLQLSMQSVSITTDVLSSNLDQGFYDKVC